MIATHNIVKVIRKRGDYWNSYPKYYTSVLNERHYVYCFFNARDVNRCYDFLEKYKSVNGAYPSSFRYNKLSEAEDFQLEIDSESLIGLKKRCLLNDVGLIGVKDFKYNFIDKTFYKKNIFQIDFDAVDLLDGEPEPHHFEYIDNLNYILQSS